MNQPISKPNRKKIIVILIIIVCVILWCVAVYGVASLVLKQTVDNLLGKDPDRIALIGAQIADYELPPGFSTPVGSSFMGIDMLFFSDSTGDTQITLMQAPDNITGSKISADDMLINSKPLGLDNPMTWKKVDVKLFTIRGEKTAITVYENQTKEYIAWTCQFQGKGGHAMLMIVGSKKLWDAAALEAFLKSMR
jgi:hypothetical protein